MQLDIVTVLFYSDKWISNYLDALSASDYPLSDVNLILIDNTPDGIRPVILNEHPVRQQLSSIVYAQNPTNVGFGAACNLGTRKGNSSYVLFLNIDTALTKDSLSELAKAIRTSAPEVGAWEMRQLPYEHPKIYHPVTQYTSWASGAAFCVKRNILDETGGFDERIFLYAEDVDLSWAIRKRGYQIRYCPKSTVYHFSYEDGVTVKPLQLYNELLNNLMLRFKYGSITDIIKGYIQVERFKRSSSPLFPDQRIGIRKMMKGSFLKGLDFRSSNTRGDFKPIFQGLSYERMRSGAFYKNIPLQTLDGTPKISVIVRTHKRPLVLEEAIICLINQTYPDIEIVVVEDGENTAQFIIDKYKPLANIHYYHTGVQMGRSHAGNLGMSKASGEYLAFLDDDDLLYADHFETLMSTLMQGKYDAVHAPAFSVPTKVISTDPYRYEEYEYTILHEIPFSKEEIVVNNLFPIQAILFRKQFFDDFGGFDTTIDYLEDWALWLKYFKTANVGFANKLTSLYRVPADKTIYRNRQQQLSSTYNYVLEKYGDGYSTTGIVRFEKENMLQRTTDLIPHHIDYIRFNGTRLTIDGWAISDGEAFDQIFVVFDANGTTESFPLSRVRRQDINDKYKTGSGILGFGGTVETPYSGFRPFSIMLVKNNIYTELSINRLIYFKTLVIAKLRSLLKRVL